MTAMDILAQGYRFWISLIGMHTPEEAEKVDADNLPQVFAEDRKAIISAAEDKKKEVWDTVEGYKEKAKEKRDSLISSAKGFKDSTVTKVSDGVDKVAEVAKDKATKWQGIKTFCQGQAFGAAAWIVSDKVGLYTVMGSLGWQGVCAAWHSLEKAEQPRWVCIAGAVGAIVANWYLIGWVWEWYINRLAAWVEIELDPFATNAGIFNTFIVHKKKILGAWAVVNLLFALR